MTQLASHSHAEAFANVVVGTVAGQLIIFAGNFLGLWNMTFASGLELNIIMIFQSYWRSFLIRRFFNGIEGHGKREGSHIQKQIRAGSS